MRPALAVTPDDAATATGLITTLDDTLLSIMKEGKTLGFQGRFDRMAPVVDKTFDIPFMTKFIMNSKWATLTQDQQTAMIDAFRKYTIGQYANRFADYDGETFAIVGQPTDQRDDVRLQTVLTPKAGTPIKLDYIFHHDDQADRKLQAIDVFLNGTISELATQRSEFQSVFAAQGVDGLIAMLDKKAGDTSPSATAQGGASGQGSDKQQ
jgi:phospholipid transport system substrate-binding protein